ncbi:DUF4377 domain-containing protein [Moraxella marmotae]|uniref:DUF4377 domain-containing protein n=1 Tax=Moraxella marmotae TaxID=3344520 RepID=UPI0035F4528A
MKLPVFQSRFTTLFAIFGVFATSIAFTACYNVGDAVNGAVHDMKGQQGEKSPKTLLAQGMYANMTADDKPYQPATAEVLANYNWQLVSAEVQGAAIQRYEAVINNHTAYLSFSESSLSYTLGCNHHRVNYQIQNGVIKLTNNGTSTLMGCPAMDDSSDLNEVEAKFTTTLGDASLQILTNPDDYTAILVQQKGAEMLTYRGMMKNDVRFGEPVRLFWEIDSEMIDCVDKAGHDKQCLRVRNVNYDDKGIKVGSGAWRTFYGEIHGFEHQQDQRQIIRLNAYNNPDGKENPYYVFDMVVEAHLLDITK